DVGRLRSAASGNRCRECTYSAVRRLLAVVGGRRSWTLRDLAPVAVAVAQAHTLVAHDAVDEVRARAFLQVVLHLRPAVRRGGRGGGATASAFGAGVRGCAFGGRGVLAGRGGSCAGDGVTAGAAAAGVTGGDTDSGAVLAGSARDGSAGASDFGVTSPAGAVAA